MAGKITEYTNTRTTFVDGDLFDVSAFLNPGYESQKTTWLDFKNNLNSSGYLTSVALDDLTDATITAPSNGEVLTYNGSAWVNQAAGVGGGIYGGSGSLTANTTVTMGANTLTFDKNVVFQDSKIGSAVAGFASWSHKDLFSTGNLALSQDSLGTVELNASTGQEIQFSNNGATIATLDENGFGIGVASEAGFGVVTDGEIKSVNAVIGNALAGYASFAHKDMFNSTSYALLQSPAGGPDGTLLNAELGKPISFRINNVEKLKLDSTGFDNKAGVYKANGTSGVASFTGAVTSITITNGIVTAIS